MHVGEEAEVVEVAVMVVGRRVVAGHVAIGGGWVGAVIVWWGRCRRGVGCWWRRRQCGGRFCDMVVVRCPCGCQLGRGR